MIFFLRRITNPPPFARVVAMLVAVLAYGSTGFVFFELGRWFFVNERRSPIPDSATEIADAVRRLVEVKRPDRFG